MRSVDAFELRVDRRLTGSRHFGGRMLDRFGAGVQPDGRLVDDREYLLVSGLRR